MRFSCINGLGHFSQREDAGAISAWHRSNTSGKYTEWNPKGSCFCVTDMASTPRIQPTK